MICPRCGKCSVDTAKFCYSCGMQLQQVNRYKNYTCYYCGGVMNSFVTRCNYCGRELRGVSPAYSLIHFRKLLQQYDIKITKNGQQLNTEDIQRDKAEFINSFPIPNTKEDIKEFIILSASSINISDLTIRNNSSGLRKIAEAWRSKMEQSYNKAKMTFQNDNDYALIEKLYNDKQKEIKKQLMMYNLSLVVKRINPYLLSMLLLFVASLLTIFIILNSVTKENNKKRNEIHKIETEIEICIKNEEYDEALLKVNSLQTYYSFDSDLKKEVKDYKSIIKEKQKEAKKKK